LVEGTENQHYQQQQQPSSGTIPQDEEDDIEPSGFDPQLLCQDDFSIIAHGNIASEASWLAEPMSRVMLEQPGDGEGMASGTERLVDEEEDRTTSSTQPTNSRLHGVTRSKPGERLAEGNYFETAVFLPHRFDSLLEDTCQAPLSDVELAEMIMPFLQTMHPLERYPENLAPHPGAFECRSCRKDLGSLEEFNGHVVKCRKQHVAHLVELEWNNLMDERMAEPCGWATRKEESYCEKTFSDRDKFCRHIMQHSWNKDRCRFGDCVDKSPLLATRNDWLDHLSDTHGITYLRPSSLFFYCSFCNDYCWSVNAGPSRRTKHYDSHLIEALERVKLHGYNEVKSSYSGTELLNVRHPWFCIFCLHNPSLTADERLAIYSEGTGKAYPAADQRAHLSTHLLSIKDYVYCPASILAQTDFPLCSATELYDAQQLEKHLEREHCIYQVKGIVQSGPKKKRIRIRGKAKERLEAGKNGSGLGEGEA